ncbi:MAG: FAD-binding oxidoreductase [Candidatus Kaiserbacteria bacterium]|nr:MAG: FAD-binding oxidoreductase [Candidatus Kaiserbacteria bacterium]
MTLRERLAPLLKGDVADDDNTRALYSHDTSIFERRPSVVVFPKDADDVAAVVRFVREAKEKGEDISIAPRSAGTDMTGGPLTSSISLVFTKYMQTIEDVGTDYAIAEPGVYYRDFEKITLSKAGALIPSYPASREICALGGMIGNNSGGELTLKYGQTRKYVRALDVILSDGSKVIMRPLTRPEWEQKESQHDFEGAVYREVRALIEEHIDEIEKARPSVSKNSAGYALWEVWDREHDTFDITQLITGSQGTLGIVTKAKIGLVKLKPEKSMLVIFLSDLNTLPEIVRRVLALSPESFESYDDQTFRLAVRFMPQIIRHFGFLQMVKLGFSFIPETWMALTGGVPKLVLLAEFAEDSLAEARKKAHRAADSLHGIPVKATVAGSETAAAKYWTIRRESFSLLRKNLRGLHAAPFIDDIVVHPADYPAFLPELQELLGEYDLIYTIAGHIGDADFHIIPLMNLGEPKSRQTIMELDDRVYRLVAKYHGSITGEHNDGIVRTPYLPIMFGEKMCDLFAKVKRIFDPAGILNPGKKVGGTLADIERDMIRHG